MASRPSIGEWVRRSFGSWGRPNSSQPPFLMMAMYFVADYVDDIRLHEIAAAVDQSPYETDPSGDTELRFARRRGKLLAYDGDRVACTVCAGGVGVARGAIRNGWRRRLVGSLGKPPVDCWTLVAANRLWSMPCWLTACRPLPTGEPARKLAQLAPERRPRHSPSLMGGR